MHRWILFTKKVRREGSLMGWMLLDVSNWWRPNAYGTVNWLNLYSTFLVILSYFTGATFTYSHSHSQTCKNSYTDTHFYRQHWVWGPSQGAHRHAGIQPTTTHTNRHKHNSYRVQLLTEYRTGLFNQFVQTSAVHSHLLKLTNAMTQVLMRLLSQKDCKRELHCFLLPAGQPV